MDGLQPLFRAGEFEQARAHPESLEVIEGNTRICRLCDGILRLGNAVIAQLQQDEVIDLLIDRHRHAAHADARTIDVERRLRIEIRPDRLGRNESAGRVRITGIILVLHLDKPPDLAQLLGAFRLGSLQLQPVGRKRTSREYKQSGQQCCRPCSLIIF